MNDAVIRDLMLTLEAENGYLNLPPRHDHTPILIATGGLPGSGKSTLGLGLVPATGAVLLRADAIRKHLAGVSPNERGPATLYTPEHSRLTNLHIRELATTLLDRNWSVILDATHVSGVARTTVENIAWEKGVEFAGFWCHAPHPVLRKRVAEREKDVSDADTAILEQFIQRDTHGIPPLTVAWEVIDATRPPTAMLDQALHTTRRMFTSAERC